MDGLQTQPYLASSYTIAFNFKTCYFGFVVITFVFSLCRRPRVQSVCLPPC